MLFGTFFPSGDKEHKKWNTVNRKYKMNDADVRDDDEKMGAQALAAGTSSEFSKQKREHVATVRRARRQFPVSGYLPNRRHMGGQISVDTNRK